MSRSSEAWLVVVDMQACFADVDGEWWVPGYSAVEGHVRAMVESFGERVVLTRFVSGDPDGAGWRDYYTRWSGMLRSDDDPVWDLTFPRPPGVRVITRATFSKWDEELEDLIPRSADVVICGVSTETCVLATALGAVDSGRRVMVVPTACAGATAALHDAALEVLRSFAPNVTLTDVEGVLALTDAPAT